ncbi:GntR family transcriptional regulator [Bailinhaonella thermotolerans]|uniref:GntR family transcriptional regulator n=1 Tax=Bailinhaonella thermotolerans TaxID=1070861 RepID=UPI001F5B2EA7|nr:GntR family transcriptional regulator [Bailinhaonella thermotolerans]
MSAVEALAAALRERILSGEIVPGAPLPEQDLAAAYGVARPTVREAIATLVHEGILRRERNRSAYVPEVTAEDLADLLYARRPLDHAVAAALSGRRVPEADAALDRIAALPAGAPWSEIVREHDLLHDALVAAVGSPRLVRLYAALAAETRLGVAQLQASYPDRDVLVTQHRALLDGIASGDPDAVRQAVDAHIELGWHDLLP